MVVERAAQAWAHDRARMDEWRGMSLYAVDGTMMRVPDFDEGREYFGSARGQLELFASVVEGRAGWSPRSPQRRPNLAHRTSHQPRCAD